VSALRFAWLRRLLERRATAFVVIALAAVLVSPSLGAGLAGDDLIHALALRGDPPAPPGFERAPLDLFRFTSPEVNPDLFDIGILPWWADPGVRFAFFRPLSAATHWLDYLLWPSSPGLMHAQSILWFLFGLVAVGSLYRTLLTRRWVAMLALALYAFDDLRGATVGWVANRNALVAFAFSMGAVAWHHRAVAGDRRARWIALGLFALGLLSAEGGIAGAAYLVAHAAVLDGRRLRARVLAMAPYAAVVVFWAAVSRALGYGVAGSGEYFDPLRSPVLYLSALPGRATALLFAQLSGNPADWWNAYDEVSETFPYVFLATAWFCLSLFTWLVAPLVRRSATARFWTLGMLLALLPAASAFPARPPQLQALARVAKT
jgi:hypothetical protein